MCISKLEKAQKNVSSEMKELDRTFNDILEDIDFKFTTIISSAEKRCNEVKALAREMHAAKKKILDDQMKMIESEKAKIEAGCDKIKEEGNIHQINTKVNDLSVQKRSMRSLLNPKQNWFMSCDNMEEPTMNLVKATIQSIGTIRSSTTCPHLCEINIGQCFAEVDTSAELITFKYSGERQHRGGDIVSATLEELNGNPKIPIRIHGVIDKGDGTYELKFIPPKCTTYHLKVEIFGHPIKTYPLEFEVNSFENYIISRGWAQASATDLSNVPKKICHLPLFSGDVDVDGKIRCATPVSLSSRVWICAASSSSSQICIVDTEKNLEDVQESFKIPNNILCLASVPIISTDLVFDPDKIDLTDVKLIQLTPRSCEKSSPSDRKRKQEANKERGKRSSKRDNESEKSKKSTTVNDSQKSSTSAVEEIVAEGSRPTQPPEEVSTIPNSNNQSMECLPSSSAPADEIDTQRDSRRINLAIPTVWLGGKDGTVHIYDEENNRTNPLTSIKLPSPVVQIIHHRGKVFVALVDGRCCIFIRLRDNSFWDLTKYFSLDMKEKNAVIDSHSQRADDANPSSGAAAGYSSKLSSVYQNYSVRCMEAVGIFVWLGYRNSIYILDCETLKIVNHFEVDSREKARITQITAAGDGMWCSTQLDSKVHLYSASQPFQHLQCIDAEPHITKPLRPESFDFGKIIAMKACQDRLWVGTNRGVITNIPYRHQASISNDMPASFLPKCDEARKQLSLHGHGEIVKFILKVKNFIISGGDGYDDRVLNLRETSEIQADKRSHLIIWKRDA